MVNLHRTFHKKKTKQSITIETKPLEKMGKCLLQFSVFNTSQVNNLNTANRFVLVKNKTKISKLVKSEIILNFKNFQMLYRFKFWNICIIVTYVIYVTCIVIYIKFTDLMVKNNSNATHVEWNGKNYHIVLIWKTFFCIFWNSSFLIQTIRKEKKITFERAIFILRKNSCICTNQYTSPQIYLWKNSL